ncbi:unnamed protein product [Lathyrus sativus]|nr:unnamed protein product [Lathyrus sativus]
MTILLFNGEEDAYWWILCFEKFFKKHGTPESLKVLKAVGALRGSALKWWIWCSRVHHKYSWDKFTTTLLWRFKPEWRNFLPEDEEDDPALKSTYESMEFMDPISETVEDDVEESSSSDLCRKSLKSDTLDRTLAETEEESEETEENCPKEEIITKNASPATILTSSPATFTTPTTLSVTSSATFTTLKTFPTTSPVPFSKSSPLKIPASFPATTSASIQEPSSLQPEPPKLPSKPPELKLKPRYEAFQVILLKTSSKNLFNKVSHSINSTKEKSFNKVSIVEHVYLGGDVATMDKQMHHLGIVVPDEFPLPCVSRAYGSYAEVLEIKKIHGLLFKLGLELYVGSALVNTYLNFGLMADAHEVFEEYPVRDLGKTKTTLLFATPIHNTTIHSLYIFHPPTISDINVKLVVEPQFKNGGFHNEADFAIPPKPPDQIGIPISSLFLPCFSKQFIQRCLDKEDMEIVVGLGLYSTIVIIGPLHVIMVISTKINWSNLHLFPLKVPIESHFNFSFKKLRFIYEHGTTSSGANNHEYSFFTISENNFIGTTQFWNPGKIVKSLHNRLLLSFYSTSHRRHEVLFLYEYSILVVKLLRNYFSIGSLQKNLENVEIKEELIKGRKPICVSFRNGKEWDLGGELDLNMATNSSFEQWDPGKINLAIRFFTTLRTRLILKG